MHSPADLTRCNWSAAQLAGCDPRPSPSATRGATPTPILAGPLIDPFREKIEELVERSKGVVRADKVHEHLVAMGFVGDERTTPRAVAEANESWIRGWPGGLDVMAADEAHSAQPGTRSWDGFGR